MMYHVLRVAPYPMPTGIVLDEDSHRTALLAMMIGQKAWGGWPDHCWLPTTEGRIEYPPPSD